MSTPKMFFKKIAQIEKLVEKYKERIKVIQSTRGYANGGLTYLAELETLETVIEDLEAII